MTTPATPARRVLAIASGGGHWVQLLRLRPAFEAHDVVYATVDDDYRSDLGASDQARFRVVVDATEWQPLLLIKLALQVGWIVVRTRPQAVVTTGAAPGLMAVIAGRLIGARTMWIDSVANVERLSKSGRLARRVAERCVTQWPEVARDGVIHAGSVL